MPRFVGIKNNLIKMISDSEFNNPDLQVVELPIELENVSSSDLLLYAKYKDGIITMRSQLKKAKDLKVAFVSNYGSKCGIGTYSKFLYGELLPMVGDYRLFLEDTDELKEFLNSPENKIPLEKIESCWNRGTKMAGLVAKIRAYNPDIVQIQHEFGLFSDFKSWLTLLNQLSGFRVIITMHSVFYHADKTVAEAAMPEIIVHLNGAHNVLKNVKKLSSNVHVVPHGCFPCVDRNQLWNCYKTDYNFMQFGFLYRYKAVENSIKATYLLKQKYPDVFFTALCSESAFSKVDHQIYYNELMALIENLGLTDNVALIRGFQSEEVLNSFLRTNKAAVFPYVSNKEHECFGSSGAAPFAMTKGVPVITSSVHHFEDLPTIKADSPEEIADALNKVFSSGDFRKAQVDAQCKYLEDNSWKNTAAKYVEIFEKAD
jgi:glycosyltransferase involved in cell wall biosynthesis